MIETLTLGSQSTKTLSPPLLSLKLFQKNVVLKKQNIGDAKKSSQSDTFGYLQKYMSMQSA